MKGFICDSNQYKHIIENKDDIIDDSIAIDVNNEENSDADNNEQEGNKLEDNVNKEIVEKT